MFCLSSVIPAPAICSISNYASALAKYITSCSANRKMNSIFSRYRFQIQPFHHLSHGVSTYVCIFDGTVKLAGMIRLGIMEKKTIFHRAPKGRNTKQSWWPLLCSPTSRPMFRTSIKLLLTMFIRFACWWVDQVSFDCLFTLNWSPNFWASLESFSELRIWRWPVLNPTVTGGVFNSGLLPSSRT